MLAPARVRRTHPDRELSLGLEPADHVGVPKLFGVRCVGGSQQPEDPTARGGSSEWLRATSRPRSSHSQACPWSLPCVQLSPVEVRVFWLNSQVLAYTLKSISPKRHFFNQINKEMGEIFSLALGPGRCNINWIFSFLK